ncbi:MAG: cadherin-like domain-containing protein, partial [Planctomycetota bacterium]
IETQEIGGAPVGDSSEVSNGYLYSILAPTDDPPTDLSSGIEINTDGGNDAYFRAVAADDVFGDATELTVEMSVALDSPSGTAPHFLSFSTAAEPEEFKVYLSTSDRISVTIGGTTFVGNAHPELRDGAIHQVGVTWDNTRGDIAIYVDGELSSAGNVAAGYTLGSTGSLVFGQGQPNSGMAPIQAMEGTFYDIRVWETVQTEAEIALNHQEKFDSTNLPTGLIANWQFDGFDHAGEIPDIVSGYNSLSVQHATGAGFTESVAVEDLNVDENAANGTTVGFVVPTNPEVGDDILIDGRFTEQSITGQFETLTAPATFGDWEVTNNQAVVYDDPSVFGETPLQGRPVELGNAAGPATIQQTLNTVAGQTYQVTFATTGDFTVGTTTNNLRVTANGSSTDFSVSDPVGWTHQDPVWDHRTLTFTATGSTTTLAFESLEASGSNHSVIGDVSVVEVPAAVAEVLANDPQLSYNAATGKFYKYLDTPYAFADAQAHAETTLLNGVASRLVTINDAGENDYVASMIAAQGITDVHLGASDAGIEGQWRWEHSGELFWTGDFNGSPTAGTFAGWKAGEPNDAGNEDFAGIFSDGTWNDGNESQLRSSIVEWDANEVLSGFQFKLLDDAGGRFAIDGTSGEITILDNSLLSFESNPTHNVTVEVTDAAGNTYSEVMEIVVNDTNDAPLLDLDADNSSGPGSAFYATFTELGGPISITDSDASLTDADSTTITSLQAQIVNQLDGSDERLSVNPTPAPWMGLTVTYDAAIGKLTISGTATVAEYQQFLRALNYENLSSDPDTTQRLINIVASDGTENSLVAQSKIDIVSANQGPTVIDNGGSVNEGDYATLTVDMIEATDSDDAASELTYTVSNLVNGQLELGSSPGSPITSFTQAQIDSGDIVFLHDGSETTVASFDYSLADGGEDGATPVTGTFSFAVSPMNDVPVINSAVGGGTYSEGSTGTFFHNALTINDPDSLDFDGGKMHITISANGEVEDRLFVMDGSGVTVVGNNVLYDSGSGAVVVGTLAGGDGLNQLVITFNANSDIESVQAVGQQVAFRTESDDPVTNQRQLTMQLTDGDSGASNLAVRSMNVVAQNDAPIASLT